MSARPKKGKKSQKDKKKPPKISYVEEAFYKLDVEDAEKKIERLRNHLENLDTSNNDIKEKIRSLNEDKVDKAADLTRNLNALDETIYKYNEEIAQITQELYDIRACGTETITDLEEKHKAMYLQLTGELKLLKAKLQMLEDFRAAANKLNADIANEKQLYEDEKRKYENKIAETEIKIRTDRDIMKREIVGKLLQVSADFQSSSALRNASYAQRLIRENIALEKEIDVLKVSQETIDQQLKEHVARCKEVKETFPALIRKRRELIFLAQQKTNQVEKLTTKYEKLKSAYTEGLLYKKQYQDLVQYRLCKHQQRHQLITQTKKLVSRCHKLRTECNYLEYIYERNEEEIARLRNVIQLIRKTILQSLNIEPKTHHPLKNNISVSVISTNSLVCESESCTSDINVNENCITFETCNISLLQKLIDILEYVKVETAHSESIESAGGNSFLLWRQGFSSASSGSLRQMFVQPIEKRSSITAEVVEETQIYKHESKIFIPNERVEHGLIFDVEKGSSFYASSSKSKQETFEERDEELDEYQHQESSSYESLISQKAEIEKPAERIEMSEEKKKDYKSEITVEQMPPGTIVDVEMVELDDDEEFTAGEEVYFSDNEEKLVEDIDAEDKLSMYMFY